MSDDSELLKAIAAATAEASRAAAAAAQVTAQAMEIAANAGSVAAQALGEIRTHSKVCEVLQKQLVDGQAKAEIERVEMHKTNQESIRRLYGLVWKLVIGVGGFVIVTLIGWVAALLWYVITK